MRRGQNNLAFIKNTHSKHYMAARSARTATEGISDWCAALGYRGCGFLPDGTAQRIARIRLCRRWECSVRVSARRLSCWAKSKQTIDKRCNTVKVTDRIVLTADLLYQGVISFQHFSITCSLIKFGIALTNLRYSSREINVSSQARIIES